MGALKGVLKNIRFGIVALCFSIPTQAVFADSYTLIFDSACSSTGEKLQFRCKSEPRPGSVKTTIFSKDGKWMGMEGANTNAFPLSLVKADTYVVVFDYPVLYSGMATIVLIKKTGRFYFSEISYSEALNVQDATIEGGRFITGK